MTENRCSPKRCISRIATIDRDNSHAPLNACGLRYGPVASKTNVVIMIAILAVVAVTTLSCTSTPTTPSVPLSDRSSLIATGNPHIVLPVCNCEEHISTDEFVVVRLRWGARTKNMVERGADWILYEIRVDNTDISDLSDYRKPAVFVPKSAYGEDAWWVYWDYPLGKLPEGDHMVEATFVATKTVYDGWKTFQKGDLERLRVLLHVGEPEMTDKVRFSADKSPLFTSRELYAVEGMQWYVDRYVFTGTSKDEWTEALELHNYVLAQVTTDIETMAKNLQEMKLRKCIGARVEVLKHEPRRIMWKVVIADCPDVQETSVSVLLYGNWNIFLLTYTNLTADVPEETINKWIGCLDGAVVFQEKVNKT